MTDAQFYQLIDAIISSGQADLWGILGVLTGFILVILTAAYVFYTSRMLKTSLKTLQMVQGNLFQERLIDVSRQWNSLEFVEARNRANALIEPLSPQKRVTLYRYLVGDEGEPAREDGLKQWIHVSLIAHFFVRLHFLVEDGQIEKGKVGREFKEQIEHWCLPLKEVYDGVSVKERRISDALSALVEKYKD